MRKFYLALAAVLTGLLSTAQTTLINPSGDGGFENGSTFASNGWTVVNGSATSTQNQWYIGTSAAAGIGSGNVAYITNNATTGAYAYTNNSAMYIVHFYRDITFPASESAISMNFILRGIGETNYDGLQVSLAPTTTTLSASATNIAGIVNAPLVSGATVIGSLLYSGMSAATPVNIVIPSSFAGTTQRLIFTFRLDGSAGTSPATAIDNISLVSQIAAPLCGGSYTIDNTQTTSGSNFASFTDAINYLNLHGVSCATVFNVKAGQSFNEDVPTLTVSGTSTNTITFQRSGAGANPQIRPTGTAGSADFGVCVSGGDYFTFDGIDINVASGSAVEYGYLIRNASPTNGAANNTIKNCRIVLNRSNTSSYGIFQTTTTTGGGVTPTATSGSNSNNKYYNFTIENVFSGIRLLGVAAFPDAGNEVGVTAGGTSTIGAASASDIGNGSSSSVYGVFASAQNTVKIFNIVIRNLTHTSTSTLAGVYIDNTSTGTYGVSEIYNNQIFNIARTTSTSSSGNVYGIRADVQSTAGNEIRVYNNFVYGLSFSNPTTSTSSIVIRALAGNVSGTGVVSFYYNSVLVNHSSLGLGSAALFTGGGTISIQNNILMNTTPAQSGTSKHYAIYRSAGTLTSDYNDLFVANTNGFVGFFTSDQATIANWRTASSADANSINVDPDFISSTNLHIAPSNASVDGKATPNIITTDIDGETRNGTSPDIGADEYTVLTGVDVSVTGLVAPLPPVGVGCYSNAETVTVTIRNAASSLHDFSVNPVTVTVNVTGALTTTLTTTINSGTLAAGASQNVSMSTQINMTVGGTYTFNSNANVAGDINAANDAMAAVSRVVAPTLALPQVIDFSGFSGSNLTTVFPNWTEAAGTSVPSGTSSLWTLQDSWSPANTTAKVNLYTNNRNEWIVGPKVVATATTTLKFDVAITDFSSVSADASGMQGTDDKVMVKISSDCGQTFTTLYTFDASNTSSITNSLVPQTIDLSAYAGQQVIIAFHASDGPIDNVPDYDFHIDNIQLSDASSCLPATGLSASGATGFSTNVSWNGTGTFILEYGPAGFTPGSGASAGVNGTLIIPATSPQAITGLTPSTAYDVYIRRDCSGQGNGYSANSSKLSFTTTVACPFPTSVNVSGTSTSANVAFTGSGSNFIVEYGLAGFTPGTGASAGTNGTIVVGTSSPITITGLAPSTSYDFFVRQDCSGAGNGFSTNSTKVSFTTAVACPVPTSISVLTTTTTASVTFSSSGTSFIVEYGPAGFTPGTGSSAGTNGAIVTGTASPITITGLTASTGYDFYLRQDCSGNGNGFSSNSTKISRSTTAFDHDNSLGAATLSQGAYSATCAGMTYTTVGATSSSESSACFFSSQDDDIWFKFTATDSKGIIKISNYAIAAGSTAVGNFNYAIYTGTPGTLTEFDCEVSNVVTTTNGGGEIFIRKPLSVGQTYYIRAMSNVTTGRATFNICVMTPDVASNTTANTCVTATSVTISTANANTNVWVPVFMADGKLVAEINANGNSLGAVTTKVYRNTNAVRTDSKRPYLDRNIEITPATQPTTPVSVRLYLIAAELTALQNTPGSNVSGIADLGVFKNNEACRAGIIALANPVASTSGSTYEGNYMVSFDVSSFSSFYMAAKTFSILPANIVTFSGVRQGGANQLKWTVAQERDVHSYEVERSEDGRTWTTAGSVRSLGNSSSERSYSFTDNSISGIKQLYRLRQVDVNGASKLSNVVSITGNRTAVLTLAGLFPNPAVSKVNLLVEAPAKDNLTITVMDAVGRIVRTQRSFVDAGSNTLQVDVSGFAQGSYLIKVTCENGCQTLTGKFIKE